VLRTLRTRIWASIPRKELGRRLTRQEEDAILGYGPISRAFTLNTPTTSAH
jgi:hypothetical protein